MEKESLHWADQAAEQIIKRNPKKKEYVVATGATPSGTLHIGNFREFIMGDFIAKALKHQGKNATHYHYWDDYDVFRKVPVNMPKADVLKKHLRQALVNVPDVVDGKHKNYAEHSEEEFEKLLPIVGLSPTIIKNSEQYQKCILAEQIKIALENTDKIKDILNKFRREELEEGWLPISIYDEETHFEAEEVEYVGGYEVKYKDQKGEWKTFDFRKKGLLKLKYRIQVPAFWHYKGVDFESAGKDHYAAGGVFNTAALMAKEVYGIDRALGFGFGWIGIKGGKQFSSSKGIIFTLKDVLEVYEPEIVRYFFAGSRPSAEFAISFDLDVLKVYEDFDKCERIYFKEEKVDKKEFEKQKRIYELSSINIPKKLPYQPGLRHLTTVLQVYEKDVKKAAEFFKEFLKTKEDKERFDARCKCVLNWLEKYAPEEFKFTVQEKVAEDLKLDKKQKDALQNVAKLLKGKVKDDKELHEKFYDICKELDLKPGEFFKAAYLVLLNKERGPRLASFILTLGVKKVIRLFEHV